MHRKDHPCWITSQQFSDFYSPNWWQNNAKSFQIIPANREHNPQQEYCPLCMDPSLPRHPPWAQVYTSCLCIITQSHQPRQSYQEDALLFVKLDVHGLGDGLRTEPCLIGCITGGSIAPYSHLDIVQALHAGYRLQAASQSPKCGSSLESWSRVQELCVFSIWREHTGLTLAFHRHLCLVLHSCISKSIRTTGSCHKEWMVLSILKCSLSAEGAALLLLASLGAGLLLK